MSDNSETVLLAGGCAWIMQRLLRHPDGVIAEDAIPESAAQLS